MIPGDVQVLFVLEYVKSKVAFTAFEIGVKFSRVVVVIGQMKCSKVEEVCIMMDSPVASLMCLIIWLLCARWPHEY